mgnify:CR=1 FL=1
MNDLASEIDSFKFGSKRCAVFRRREPFGANDCDCADVYAVCACSFPSNHIDRSIGAGVSRVRAMERPFPAIMRFLCGCSSKEVGMVAVR